MRSLRNGLRKESGFTLIEMLVSVALTLVVGGALLAGMASYQKTYRGTELKISVDQQMRSALELMSQEIGQAGLPFSRLAGSKVGAGITDNALVVKQGLGTLAESVAPGFEGWVTVNYGSTDFPFYVDQKVIIETNGEREITAIAEIDKVNKKVRFGDYSEFDPDNPPPETVTPTKHLIAKQHNVGDAIFSGGLYPEGVLWWEDGTYTATARSDTFTGYELWIYGDITNKGGLDLISYKCDATTKQLIRTAYDVEVTSCPAPNAVIPYYPASKPVATTNAKQVVLLDNVTNCDPNAAMPPFTLVPTFGSGAIAGNRTRAAVNKTPYTFITSVGITLQTESVTKDPRTNKPVVLTKSLLNVQPRNIVSGFRRASGDQINEGDTSDLQPNPHFGVFKCFPLN